MAQNNPMIKRAMILAAGLGTRMRPITESIPKPLIKIKGRPLIDHIIDRLRSHGVQKIVVNTHYLADQMEAHFKNDPQIILSHEPEILESGGGVLKALDHFEDQPFFTINGDVLWEDSIQNPLKMLEDKWDPKKMDLELMVVPLQKAFGYHGKGDYFMDGEGLLKRRLSQDSAPYVFGPIAIVNPDIFKGISIQKFSMLELYDQAQAADRLYGTLFEGGWYHLGVPQDLDFINRAL